VQLKIQILQGNAVGDLGQVIGCNAAFYPRDAMLARSLRQRRVRTSVTRRYCAKTVHFRHKVTMGR